MVTALEQRDIATGFNYHPGDIVRYTDEPCGFGQTSRQIEIVARKDDMKTVQGVNVFLKVVELVVQRMDAVNNEFCLVLELERQIDDISVAVEPNEYAEDRADVGAQLGRNLTTAFGGLTVDIESVPTGEFDRFDFKTIGGSTIGKQL